MQVIIFKRKQSDGKWKIVGYYGDMEKALHRKIYERDAAIYKIRNFSVRNKKYVAYYDEESGVIDW